MAQAESPWLAGAEQMAKSWTEAQRLLWRSWGELGQRALAQSGNRNPFAGAAEAWQRLAEEGLSAWRDERDGAEVAGEVAERLAEGQKRFLQLLEQTAEAWQALAPQLAQGGDWQQALRDYFETQSEQLREEVLGAARAALETSGEAAELWSRYLGEWRRLGRLWFAEVEGANAGAAEDSGFRGEAEGLSGRLWQVYDQTLGRAISSPTIGYGRELNAKLLAGFKAWLELRRADAEYQLLTTELWQKALESGVRALVTRAQAGQSPKTAKELLTLWIAAADEVFVREFGSEAYITAQGKLLNASMAYRLRERAILESFLSAYGLPTRTELDETHEALYELRRDLRSLRRQAAERQGSRAESNTEAALAALRREVDALRQELASRPENALEANLPLEHYSALAVAEVVERLEGLSRYQLEQLRAFELLHKNRKTLLSELDRHLREGA